MTLNLPLHEWYVDASSKWTLDYPPLFAYFEYVLAHMMAQLHAPLVQLNNHDYCDWPVVPLLRLSVILLDPLFLTAAIAFISSLYHHHHHRHHHLLAIVSIVLNPALIIVDNIHFQYNALPLSLLLLTVSALHYDYIALAAGFFSLAVNVKHTLLPLALPLVCHVLAVLRHDCASPVRTFVSTAFITIATFVVIWMPFVSIGRRALLAQIANRLFPFNRGLMHANWAPNVWAVYAVIDKMLVLLGFGTRIPDGPIMTGVIGAMKPFAALPNPTPMVCTILQVMASVPSLVRCTSRRKTHSLVQALVSVALASSLFGWHVHEKALLVALIPLAGLAYRSPRFAFAFALLSPATHLAVLDLVVQNASAVFARLFTIAFHCALLAAFGRSYEARWQRYLVFSYCSGCIIVDIYARTSVHEWLFSGRMPFVPHIMASLYSFLGVAASFVSLYFDC